MMGDLPAKTNCPFCNAEVKPLSVVCGACHRVIEKRYGKDCTSCYEIIPVENRRCHFCGALQRPGRPKSDEGLSGAPVPRRPRSPRSDSGMAVPSTASSKQVDDETMTSLYLEDLQRRVKRAWHPPNKPEDESVTVRFGIESNGKLSHCRITQSSSRSTVDETAEKAVRNASPFRPLPLCLQPDIIVEFTFDRDVFKGTIGHSGIAIKNT